MKENLNVDGRIEAIIEEEGCEPVLIKFNNNVLNKGHSVLARYICNELDEKVYLSHILFGDQGGENGVVKSIHPSRNNLFGITHIVKPVVAQIDPDNPTVVVITIVLEKEEGNDRPINEAALKMSNGDLFSMATFKDLHKTDKMKITLFWRLFFC